MEIFWQSPVCEGELIRFRNSHFFWWGCIKLHTIHCPLTLFLPQGSNFILLPTATNSRTVVLTSAEVYKKLKVCRSVSGPSSVTPKERQRWSKKMRMWSMCVETVCIFSWRCDRCVEVGKKARLLPFSAMNPSTLSVSPARCCTHPWWRGWMGWR